MRTDRRAVLLAVLGSGFASAAMAQAPVPVFGESVEVRVVNLEVEVTDRDGIPVTGLTAPDFELRVDGEPVPIQYFTEVRAGIAVAPRQAVEGDTARVPALAPGDPVGTSYLVFIDDFFSLPRDRDRVLAALREDLGRLKPEDRMALVAFDGKNLDLISTWSSSTRELGRALREAMARPAYGLRRLAERRSLVIEDARFRRIGRSRLSRGGGLVSRLDAAERQYAALLQGQMESVVAAAAAALRGFANPPGRKVMLLLSGGWPFDVIQAASSVIGPYVTEPGIPRGEALYGPLVDAANQVAYSIFAVDVPGLVSLSRADTESDAPRVGSQEFEAFLRENNENFALQHLAEATGGEALLNSRQLQALAAAEAATRSYYWLGFVPRWQGDDGRHAVDLRARSQGLRVRSRRSYFDFSRSSEVTAVVESALLFGGVAGARPLALEIGQPRIKSGRLRVPISLSLAVAELHPLATPDGPVAELELRVAAVDERGGRSAVPVIPMRLITPAAPLPEAMVGFATILELRPLSNRIIVAVYDPAAGTLWSATSEVRP